MGKISKSEWIYFQEEQFNRLGKTGPIGQRKYLQGENGEYLSAVTSSCGEESFLPQRGLHKLGPISTPREVPSGRVASSRTPLKRAIVSRSPLTAHFLGPYPGRPGPYIRAQGHTPGDRLSILPCTGLPERSHYLNRNIGTGAEPYLLVRRLRIPRLQSQTTGQFRESISCSFSPPREILKNSPGSCNMLEPLLKSR